MNQEKIGVFIREIRKSNHLTQEEFAKKYGVTYQAVSNWEHGKNLPDISLLKDISKDFNVSIDELLEGTKKETLSPPKRRTIPPYLYLGIIIFLVVLIILLIFLNKDNNFEFKTISSNCDNFTISGSLSYNQNKTAIYINNVNYCGGNDNTLYSNIECILYESNNNVETQISKSSYHENTPLKLETFLQSVSFAVDDYSRSCHNLSSDNLYLQINATDSSNKITTYKIPLSLADTCENK